MCGSHRGQGSSWPATTYHQPPKPAQPQPQPQPQFWLPPKKSQLQQPAVSSSQPKLHTSIPRAINQDKVGSPAQIILNNTQKRCTPQQKQDDDRDAQLQAVNAERLAQEKEMEKWCLVAAKEDELWKEDMEYDAQGIWPDLNTPVCMYLHSNEAVSKLFSDKR